MKDGAPTDEFCSSLKKKRTGHNANAGYLRTQLAKLDNIKDMDSLKKLANSVKIIIEDCTDHASNDALKWGTLDEIKNELKTLWQVALSHIREDGEKAIKETYDTQNNKWIALGNNVDESVKTLQKDAKSVARTMKLKAAGLWGGAFALATALTTYLFSTKNKNNT